MEREAPSRKKLVARAAPGTKGRQHTSKVAQRKGLWLHVAVEPLHVHLHSKDGDTLPFPAQNMTRQEWLQEKEGVRSGAGGMCGPALVLLVEPALDSTTPYIIGLCSMGCCRPAGRPAAWCAAQSCLCGGTSAARGCSGNKHCDGWDAGCRCRAVMRDVRSPDVRKQARPFWDAAKEVTPGVGDRVPLLEEAAARAREWTGAAGPGQVVLGSLEEST
jgi:hypothetical protein